MDKIIGNFKTLWPDSVALLLRNKIHPVKVFTTNQEQQENGEQKKK